MYMKRQDMLYLLSSDLLQPGQAKAHNSFHTVGSWQRWRSFLEHRDNAMIVFTGRCLRSSPGHPDKSSGNCRHSKINFESSISSSRIPELLRSIRPGSVYMSRQGLGVGV
mmetsp:Transcript_12322/g.29475  ORF Transcript_12322/g.29475 Transcript_12322/m.29475 type:complete len:110 (+) Transcript_12322:799-1128(+)